MRERRFRCILPVLLVFLFPTSSYSQESGLPIDQLVKLTVPGYPLRLGYSVAMTDNTIVVGALFAANLTNTGAAYVFLRPERGWSYTTVAAALTPSDGTNCDSFATSVAISADGGTIVVGAPQTLCSNSPGKAYVFVKPAGGWKGSLTETAQLTAADGLAGDALGTSISISGGTVVAGAPGTYPFNRAGAAYVFVKPATGWKNATQTAKLTSSSGVTGDEVGYSVSVEEETVVAGAPNTMLGSNSGQGVAYIFQKPAGGWKNVNEIARLSASDGAANDELGYSVSIDDNNVVAGAPYASIGSNQNEGAAYVFVEPAGGWKNITQTAKLTESNGLGGDLLGSSVAISGKVIAAGAAQYTRGFIRSISLPAYWREGAVYLFTEPSGGWTTVTSKTKVTGSDARYASYLGSSVAIKGKTLVTGAPLNGRTQGWAYVFGQP